MTWKSPNGRFNDTFHSLYVVICFLTISLLWQSYWSFGDWVFWLCLEHMEGVKYNNQIKLPCGFICCFSCFVGFTFYSLALALALGFLLPLLRCHLWLVGVWLVFPFGFLFSPLQWIAPHGFVEFFKNKLSLIRASNMRCLYSSLWVVSVISRDLVALLPFVLLHFDEPPSSASSSCSSSGSCSSHHQQSCCIGCNFYCSSNRWDMLQLEVGSLFSVEVQAKMHLIVPKAWWAVKWERGPQSSKSSEQKRVIVKLQEKMLICAWQGMVMEHLRVGMLDIL